MKQLFSFIFLCLSLSLSALNVDSIYQVIKTTDNDTLIAYLYTDLIFSELDHDIEQAKQYRKELKEHVEKVGFDEALVNYYDTSAEIERSEGNYEIAIDLYDKAATLYSKIGNQRLAAQVRSIRGYTMYQMGNYKDAVEELKVAIQMADEAESYGIKGGGLSNLGVVYRSMGKTQKAKETFERAIKTMKISNCCQEYQVIASYNIATILQDQNTKSGLDSLLALEKIASQKGFNYVGNYILNSIAYGMIETGDLKQGLDYTYKALDEAEKQGNREQLLIAYRNLGDCFSAIKDDEKTKEYYSKAEAIADSISRFDELLVTRISVSQFHKKQGNNKKAIEILEAALKLADREKASLQASEIYPILGELYLDIGKENKAREAFDRTLELNIVDKHVIQAKAALAKLFLKQNKIAQAKIYGAEALTYAQANQSQQLLQSATETLYLIAKNQGNTTKALQYLEQNTKAKNAILNRENIKNVTASELSFQFDKEKEDIAAKQAEQEARFQANLSKKQSQQNALIAGLAGIALLAFLLYRSFRIKQKSNQALAEKNRLITEQNEQLGELNYTKDRIFAIIGHDLRKPAIAFRGIAKKINYLIKKQDFDRLHALGEGLEENAFALNALTDNLLNWALSQKDMVSYSPEKIYLQEIADELTPLFERLAKDKEVRLETDIPEGLTVIADKNAMLTIIRNLIDNAVKFTPKGGRIIFKAEEIDGKISTKIIDTGVGMSQEKIKDLFVLKKGKTEQGTDGEKGTGLGLSLVKELVKINKGIIKVKSQIGKGTTFNVTLPIVAV